MTMTVFLVHLASTLLMTGAIWVVQVVHYPLFSSVGADSFRAYETRHQERITMVVAPLMVAELATAVLLVVWRAPSGIPAWMPLAGLVLVGIIWLSTTVIQVPLHSALGNFFDADVHRRLVATNWIRTLAWTVRSALAIWMAWLLVG
jgi:hypothetical protein